MGGFNQRPVVQFTDLRTDTDTFAGEVEKTPMANTCALQLTIPLVEDSQTFKTKMDAAITKNGFTQVS